MAHWVLVGPAGTLTAGPQLPRLSLMEPESEFRDIDNPPAEVERKGSRPASPEPAPRPAPPRAGLRSTRGLSVPSCAGPDDRAEPPAATRPGLLATPRDKPARRVSDSFFRPSVMEPILGRAQYSQLRKKS